MFYCGNERCSEGVCGVYPPHWSHSQTLPRSGNGAEYSLALYIMSLVLLCVCRFQLADSCYSNPNGCGPVCGGVSAGDCAFIGDANCPSMRDKYLISKLGEHKLVILLAVTTAGSTHI